MKFFNNEAEIVKTRNRVPHWQQEAATFFVTWRLKDSIPREMLDKLYAERAEWETKHPKPWTEKQEEEYHTKFSAETERLLDIGYGECVLRQPRCREAVAKSLRLFDGERFLMHSWVAMPNHVHALFSLAEGRRLDGVVGGWKTFTARDINALLGQSGALWQKSYFDRMIRDWDHMIRVARYIRRNPVKAKLREDEFTLYEADWVKKMLGCQ